MTSKEKAAAIDYVLLAAALDAAEDRATSSIDSEVLTAAVELGHAAQVLLNIRKEVSNA